MRSGAVLVVGEAGALSQPEVLDGGDLPGRVQPLAVRVSDLDAEEAAVLLLPVGDVSAACW
jgi:hypothetical protein